jgi:hypothetical protein
MQARHERVWVDALVLGGLGYLTVALVLGAWNAVAGRSFFYSSAVVGSLLFGGGASVAEVTAGPVFAANALHLLVFFAFGAAAAWTSYAAGRLPQAWYPLAVAFLFVLVHLLMITAVLGESARGALPLAVVLVASVLATAGMVAYLVRARPELVAGAHDAEHAA